MPDSQTRVTHILGNLDYGGLQRRVLMLIRQLPQYSHAVIFNSAEYGPLYAEYSAICQMFHCPYPRDKPVAALRAIPRIVQALRQAAPDVVLAHLFGNHLLVSLAAKLAHVPCVYAVAANDPVHFARSRWKPMALAQLARPFCRGEIAISEAVGVILDRDLRLPRKRIRVIPCGCDVESLVARADAGRAANPREPFAPARLLMAARAGRSKDHETAIRAMAVLRSRNRRVMLNLAGGSFLDSDQQRVQRLCQEMDVMDSVVLLGPRNDIPELMGASDAVVHSTHTEGFGNVLLEGFAARTPVIASDVPACREVLDGDRCGLLVAPSDPEALADAIELILDREDLRRQLVDTAFEHVQLHYHAKRMAADYAALIDGAARR